MREGVPVGQNGENAVLSISEAAREKIRAVLGSQEPPVSSIRVSAAGPGRYSMSLAPEGKPGLDDSVLPYEGFEVYVDSQSLPQVDGTSLDWVDTYGGGGFQFTGSHSAAGGRKQRAVPEGPEGEIWRQIQSILDDEVNPAVASHGGRISLIDVRDDVVYVEMGGGCQGCGMASVTLKSGVERMLRDRLPTIREVLDITDHAGGNNPYYAPSSK